MGRHHHHDEHFEWLADEGAEELIASSLELQQDHFPEPEDDGAEVKGTTAKHGGREGRHTGPLTCHMHILNRMGFTVLRDHAHAAC